MGSIQHTERRPHFFNFRTVPSTLTTALQFNLADFDHALLSAIKLAHPLEWACNSFVTFLHYSLINSELNKAKHDHPPIGSKQHYQIILVHRKKKFYFRSNSHGTFNRKPASMPIDDMLYNSKPKPCPTLFHERYVSIQ